MYHCESKWPVLSSHRNDLLQVSLAEGKKGAGEDVVLWSSIGVDMEQYKP